MGRKLVLFTAAALLCATLWGCSGTSQMSANNTGVPAGSNTSTGGNSGTTPPTGGNNGNTGNNGGSPPPGGSQSSACSAMAAGVGGSLNGFQPFTASNAWNEDISSATVDPQSSNIINFIGANVHLHPDFGAGLYNGLEMGIPYVVVDGTQALMNVDFNAYGDESDPGPMPIPVAAPIEGDSNPSGDQHVLVLDSNNCFLYELFGASHGVGGAWNAGSAAVWDMTSDEQRPYTWTSADAAGLPIFPGLVRYDEVATGSIAHALRFTLPQSRAAFIPPASHWASNSSNALAAPMGMRMRLKASYDISGFSPRVQVILAAMKKYGIIMADNGSAMYISGAPDDRWDNNELHTLSQVPTSAFEVLLMQPVYTASNVPQGAAPVINSFSATPVSGGTTTLSWSVSGASYLIVSPGVGAVRGNSVNVQQTQATAYTLYATNQFGRTTATVTAH